MCEHGFWVETEFEWDLKLGLWIQLGGDYGFIDIGFLMFRVGVFWRG